MGYDSRHGQPPADARSDSRPSPRELNARERMVRTAAQLIRTKGVSGTGLREVVSVADAPRGSIQHYFPGGKDQLVSEALLWTGGVAARRIERVLSGLDDPKPSALFAGTVDLWRREFTTSGFEGGCPLVAAAADTAATSDELRDVIASAFEGWLEPMADALVRTGVPTGRADALAVLLISALEGAIILSRIRQDTTPLDAVSEELGPVLDAAVVT
jgi:AcrR family transcriptional regulator